jgi:hypothetical protein
VAVKGTGSFAGRVGWSVGQLGWLDDPASKVNRYWRSIEYGNSTWPKGRVAGLWGNTPGPNARPGSFRNGDLDRFSSTGNQKFVPFFSKRGDDMGKAAQAALMYYFGITGGKVRSARTNLDQIEVRPEDNRRRAKDKDGRFTGRYESRGSGPAAQRRALFMLLQSAGEGKKVPFVTGDIKKSIQAQRFYTRAVQRFDPTKAEVEALRQVIGPLIGRLDPLSPAGKKAGRAIVAYDSVHGQARTGPRTPIASHANIASYLGGRAGLASFAASAVTTDYLRNGRGFSAGEWQVAVERVNAETARRFQDLVVELMRAEPPLRRPTGDLIEATLDRRNRYPQGTN